MNTYTQPHPTDPDDVAPVGTPDPRHRSTLTKRAKAARTTARDYGTAPVRNGSIDALMVNDGRQGTVRRVDGIGPKSVPPTYGRHQPREAVMLGHVVVAVTVLVIGIALWSLAAALDAPAHLSAVAR